MENYDVIVVGAGISGMSFTHYATKSGLKTLVLEKSPRVGGSFHSSTFEKSNTDFWLELGAHTCYNSYRNLIEVIEDCGVAEQISPRAKVPFRVLVNDRVKSFTSQINFFELLTSIPKAFSKKKVGETVESYYGSILGKKNFTKVFSALFSAVPSQNADEFPANALFKKRERRKDILKHYTMKNGLESITSAIAEHDKPTIKVGIEISEIKKVDEGYVLKTNEGNFSCHNLSICTSVTSAPALLNNISTELADKISKIRFQKIESFGVVVPKEATSIKPFAGLVPINDDFFSAVSRDTVPDENFRGFTFHFKPELLTADQKVEKICKVLGISKDQIIVSNEKLNLVPSLRLGHYELIDEIDQLLKKQNLFLSGNYFTGLSIEDCVSRSKEEVARMKQA